MFQGCINVNHPEFKKLAEDLDISVAQLRNIVANYQFTNNVDEFPTADYVRGILMGSPNIVVSKNQISLWESKYSTPMLVDSYDKAMAQKAEASKFFDEKSISVKQQANGLYEVSVNVPLTDVSFNHISKLATYQSVIKEVEAALPKYNKKAAAEKYLNDINTRFESRGIVINGFWDKEHRVYRLNYDDYNAKVKEYSNEIASRGNINFMFRTLNEKFGNIFTAPMLLTRKEYNRILSAEHFEDIENSTAKSIYRNGKWYFYGVADELSMADVAEELLHPLINDFQTNNQELFNQFLDEVRHNKEFDSLVTTITQLYRIRREQFGSEEATISARRVNNEIVTQALAQILSKKIKDRPSIFAKFISTFTEWFCKKIGLTKASFNSDLNKYIMHSEDFNAYKDFTLDDFADILKIGNLQIAINNPQKDITFNHLNELPGKDQTINIYAGTNENADLSNFAERPIQFGQTTAYTTLTGKENEAFKSKYSIYNLGEVNASTTDDINDGFAFDGVAEIFKGRSFKTVEGAFQAAKIAFTHPSGANAKPNKYWKAVNYGGDSNFAGSGKEVFILTDAAETLLHNLQVAKGSQAKALGRQIQNLNTQAWDAASSDVMKAMIGRSFEDNPQALQRLLSTGDATLTHTQDRGKWGKEFPRLLMEVRSELRGETPASNAAIAPQTPVSGMPIESTLEELSSQPTTTETEKQTETPLTRYLEENFGGYFDGSGADIEAEFPNLSKELINKFENFYMGDGKFTDEEAKEFIKQTGIGIPNELRHFFEEKNVAEEDKEYMPIPADVAAHIKDVQEFQIQMSNLVDSDIIKMSEIRENARDAVFWISDKITEIQNNPDAIFDLLTENFTPEKKAELIKKIPTMSRMDIVKRITPSALANTCKESLFSNVPDLDLLDAAFLMSDNFDALLTLGNSTMQALEHFTFQTYLHKTEVVETTVEDNAEDTQAQKNTEMAEEQGNQQEGWQIEVMAQKVIDSMSTLVMGELLKCYQLDEHGNKVLSKWGVAKRVDVKSATASILSWTQGSNSLTQMVNILKTKQKNNPWLTSLIEKLEVKPNQPNVNYQFQSQFYGVFQKHFTAFSIGKADDSTKKFTSLPVNQHPALSDALAEIKAYWSVGENAPIWTSESNVNKANLQLLVSISDAMNAEVQKPQRDNEAICRYVSRFANMFGYLITESEVDLALLNDPYALGDMSKAMQNICTNLKGAADIEGYEPFNGRRDNTFGIYNRMQAFLRPLVAIQEDSTMSSTYDNGKMYQSYVTPSYMSKLMNKFHVKDIAELKAFIDKEYLYSEWFKNDGGIRCPWLDTLYNHASNADRETLLQRKVELSFNGHNYMRNLADGEYALSMITNFFANPIKNGKAVAWYRMPIQSNKPTCDYVSFYRYSGVDMKSTILAKFAMIVEQELSRMQTVRSRNLAKNDPNYIDNFDKRGKDFVMFPFLNEEMAKHTELGKLFEKKLSQKGLTDDEGTKYGELLNKAITDFYDAEVERTYQLFQSDGVLEGMKKVNNIDTSETGLHNAVEELVWNDSLAAMNILEITVTDPAMYKSNDDLQKRLGQLHAPGVRVNVEATDANGDRVSDGFYRTILLDDHIMQSNVIDNITEVFQRRIDNAPEAQKGPLKYLLDYLVRKPGTNGKDDAGGVFYSINEVDGQAYSSPTSYRKKAIMLGQWTPHFEEVYQKLRTGNYNFDDLQVAFGAKKPFVYSQVPMNVGTANSAINTMRVGMQYKNSEYALIMADAILQGEHTSRPNLLRAIYGVMEESGNHNITKCIDTVQFKSASKTGTSAPIDLNQFLDKEDGENQAKDYLKQLIYNGTEYNSTYVRTIPYEDYAEQQLVPAHFGHNHKQAHGSQIRAITPSDLAETNPDGSVTTYDYFDPKTNETVKLTAKEFKKAYEDNIAENIQASIDKLKAEFLLDGNYSPKDQAKALSKLLQKEIVSSNRYGMELFQACSIDENTGDFRIPLGDPTQAKRVEQLINSIIKNRVNKQEIAGGPVVQVTNFGMSKNLNIRFKDKDGNTLLTAAEYKTQNPDGDYKTYLAINQATLAHYEIYAPIPNDDFFNKFKDAEGNVDIELIERTNPELLKVIAYRIPTEDKYSCLPCKIVGFVPREAGEAIVMPADITAITGSDFDVDKMFLMVKEFPDGIEYTMKKEEMRDYLYNTVVDSYMKSHQNLTTEETEKITQHLDNLVTEFMKNPFKVSNIDPVTRYLWSLYRNNLFTVKVPTEGTAYRNNKIIDMTWAVLTHSSQTDLLLNPQNFDAQKLQGYKIAAYRADPSLKWEEVDKMDMDALKKIFNKEKNLCLLSSQVQYYKQNQAASTILGMFAVQKVAHAILEGDGLSIDVEDITKTDGFTILDKHFEGKMPIDPKYHDDGATLIGKTIGSSVGASADAAKDPFLGEMNINSTTANVLNTLIRLGMTFEDASLIVSSQAISNMLTAFQAHTIAGQGTSFMNEVTDRINVLKSELKTEYNLDDNSVLYSEPLTKEELIEGLREDLSKKTELKILLAYQKVSAIAGEVRGLSYPTRFNSIANAVGPQIVDNMIMQNKLDNFPEHIYVGSPEIGYQNIGYQNIFDMHPMLSKFHDTMEIAKTMFANMPISSEDFSSVLGYMSNKTQSRFFGNRDLLNKLADFYVSYRVITNHIVDESEAVDIITKTPLKVKGWKADPKLMDNLLIKKMKTDVDKKTLAPVIKFNISEMNQDEKEDYRDAWTDLYKDPETKAIAEEIFKYCFFRGGIGFNPKTFMAILPNYIKEHLPNYGKAFKAGSSRVAPDIMVDQFFRNNEDDNSIVPFLPNGFKVIYLSDGQVWIDGNNLSEKLSNKPYIKITNSSTKKVELYKRLTMDDIEDDATRTTYVKVKSLGAKKLFVEMSESELENPFEVEEYRAKRFSAQALEYIELAFRNAGRDMQAVKDTFSNLTQAEKEAKKQSMINWFKSNLPGVTISKAMADEMFKQMC